jgi:hypothetical protein
MSSILVRLAPSASSSSTLSSSFISIRQLSSSTAARVAPLPRKTGVRSARGRSLPVPSPSSPTASGSRKASIADAEDAYATEEHRQLYRITRFAASANGDSFLTPDQMKSAIQEFTTAGNMDAVQVGFGVPRLFHLPLVYIATDVNIRRRVFLVFSQVIFDALSDARRASQKPMAKPKSVATATKASSRVKLSASASSSSAFIASPDVNPFELSMFSAAHASALLPASSVASAAAMAKSALYRLQAAMEDDDVAGVERAHGELCAAGRAPHPGVLIWLLGCHLDASDLPAIRRTVRDIEEAHMALDVNAMEWIVSTLAARAQTPLALDVMQHISKLGMFKAAADAAKAQAAARGAKPSRPL